MTLAFLIIIAFIAVRSDDEHFWPLAIFSVPAIIFAVISPYTGWWHYHLGGALDVLVLFCLSRLIIINSLVKWLAGITLASITLNLAGLIMYELYMESYLYDMSFNLLYAITIWIALTNGRFNRDSKNNGVSSLHIGSHKHS